MSASVFSNHAGTTSESFVIGKRGIKLLPGIGDPTGLIAPVGSIYARKDGAGGFYQMGADNQWVKLLTPTDITYVKAFTSADLSSGILTATHGLGIQWPNVQVWNDQNEMIGPDKVTSANTTSITVDLSSFGSIAGTWHVRVRI